ncbi:MAG: AI-2E family transporter [Proteobacteria bacterium]|nr:MAG: AI-2E family transporter [Pseudomonadota bacterium]
MDKNKIFLSTLFILVLYAMVVLFKPFLLNIAIASLLAIATIPIHKKILTLVKKPFIASGITTFLLCILFFAPIVYAISVLAKEALNFDTSIIQNTITFFKEYKLNLPESLQFLEPKIKEILVNLDLGKISSKVLANAASFGKMGAGFFTNMVLIVVFFFFANAYGRDIIEYIKSVLPMENDEIEMIFSEMGNVMSVVFYSILLTAFFEGTLFAFIGMYYGYNGFLLGILYGFCSLIPVVGGALMWLPISAYEFANDNTLIALTIALYSILIISIIADTFIKPLIIKYINNTILETPTVVNELLIFFAILAGLSTFGFWGMILGPAITTFFLSILKIYKMLKERSENKFLSLNK